MEPDCSGSFGPLLTSLAEAIAWCSSRADPRDPAALRDPKIVPRPLSSGYFESVSWVISNRRFNIGQRPAPEATGLAGGRLLVYFPDADLFDGAAEVESGGFFDARLAFSSGSPALSNSS